MAKPTKKTRAKAPSTRPRKPAAVIGRSELLDVALLLLVDLELRYRVESALLLQKPKRADVRFRPFRLVERIGPMLNQYLGGDAGRRLPQYADTVLRTDEELADKLTAKELQTIAKQLDRRLAQSWGKELLKRDCTIRSTVKKRARLARAIEIGRRLPDMIEAHQLGGTDLATGERREPEPGYNREAALESMGEIVGTHASHGGTGMDERSVRRLLAQYPNARGGYYGEVDQRMYLNPPRNPPRKKT